MAHDFNQVEALISLVRLPKLLRMVRKHLVHQVFETGAEWRAKSSFIRRPENVFTEKEVVFLGAICLVEWHHTRAHGENDDAEGEKVRRDGLVAHTKRDFGRHVTGCSDYLVAEPAFAIFSLDRAGKAEVDDLKVEIRVEHQVFQLEIPMADACLVKFVQAVDELPRVELHHRHGKASRFCDEAQHITVRGKLVGDTRQLLVAIGFYE